jgi:hypothetical protein
MKTLMNVSALEIASPSSKNLAEQPIQAWFAPGGPSPMPG